jgi:hypothetical protein
MSGAGEDQGMTTEEERDRAVAACRKALEAIAPCVVGWAPGSAPVWAEKLLEVVPDLQEVLSIQRDTTGQS